MPSVSVRFLSLHSIPARHGVRPAEMEISMKIKTRIEVCETIAEEFARLSKAPPTPWEKLESVRSRVVSAEKTASIKASQPGSFIVRRRKG